MRLKVRHLAVMAGIVLLIVAIVPDLQDFNGLGPVQTFLALVGLALLFIGLFQRRVVRVYTSIALILLNALLLIVTLDVTLGVIEVGLGRLESMRGLSEQAANELLKRNHPYYATQVWSDDLWAETNRIALEYHPFVLWREKPQSGAHVNVLQNATRLIPGTRCDSGSSYRVFLFGGSTMFGIGSPDDMTIGAYLQELLQDRLEQDVCIVNYASSGWVSTQGVIELIRQLQVRHVPDQVIFFDGYNDSLAAANSGIPNGDYSDGVYAARFNCLSSSSPTLSRWFLTSTNTGRALTNGLGIDFSPVSNCVPPPHIEQPITNVTVLAGSAARTYFTNYQTVAALAEQYGFNKTFFLQPALGLGDKPMTAFETDLMQLYADRLPVFEAVYAHIRAEIPDHPGMYDLADLFSSVTETLYFDPVHVTPVGNEQIARSMVETLMAASR